MKVWVAIPAYDGKVACATMHSLVNEIALAAQNGIKIEFYCLPGMSLVHMVRNWLAYKFLYETDAGKLMFVDADVGWRAGSMLHVLGHKEHVVAGGVRRRSDPEDYAVQFLDTGVEQDERTKLIEIASIGMAFTAITRKALQTFRDKTPELAYEFNGKQMHGFFQCPINGGRAVGEDVYFCHKWRELGGKVFLDPRHLTTHNDGVRIYSGCIGTWLNARIAQTKEAA
jgi:hypothetical protein